MSKKKNSHYFVKHEIHTWFSANQRAFKLRLVKVKGKCWRRFPETSRTCNSLQVPISDGILLSLFSRRESTPRCVNSPIKKREKKPVNYLPKEKYKIILFFRVDWIAMPWWNGTQISSTLESPFSKKRLLLKNATEI